MENPGEKIGNKGVEGWSDNFRNMNWKFYLGVAATLALSGIAVGALYYSTRPSTRRKSIKKDKKGGAGIDDIQPLLQEVEKDPFFKGSDADELNKIFEMDEKAIVDLSDEIRVNYSKKMKDQGNSLYRYKKYEQAIEAYTKALQFSKNPIFYSNRAACYIALNNYTKVVEDCSAALLLDPLYIRALVRRATAHEALDAWREALDDFVAAYILSKNTSEASQTGLTRVLQAITEREADQLFRERGPILPAAHHINELLEPFLVDPKTQPFESSKGNDYFTSACKNLQEQKFETCFQELSSAIENNTDFMKEALNLRGMFHFLYQEYDLCEKDAKRALEIEPKNKKSTIVLCTSLSRRGHTELAIELLEELITISPNDAELWFQLGHLSISLLDYDKVTKANEKVVELEPNHLYGNIQLGAVYHSSQRHEDADRVFKNLLEIYPNSSKALNCYGEVMLNRFVLDEALVLFDKSIQADPTSPIPYINKSLLYIHKGDYETAAKMAEMAVKLDPRSEASLSLMSNTYMLRYQLREAAETFGLAASISAQKQDTLRHLTYKEGCLSLLRFLENFQEFTPEQATKSFILPNGQTMFDSLT